MLDDGSVIIEDGWGSSIVMTKGHIQISAAGDVFMRPGRSFYAWAPKDAMLRAGGSIDLTATTKDIRLKAECNLHLLAGNDGPKSTKKSGGILLESRSAGMTLDFNQAGEKVISGGVIVKCTNSDFVTWANNIYLGTKKIDKNPAGTIFLSADEGKQNIFVQGAQVIRDIRAAAIDVFEEKNVNYYRAQGAVLDSRLVVRGAIAAVTENAGLYVQGSIAAVGGINTEGSVAADGSVSYGGNSPTMLAPNDHALKGKIKPIIDQIATQSSRAKQGSLTQSKEINKRFQQNEGSIGSAATVKKVSFSLRVEQDYKADSFKITLSRWQQMCEELGVSTDKWVERPVLFGGTGGQQTYPFPGRLKYEANALYGKPTFNLFSFTEGHAVDREQYGGPYAARTNAGGYSGLFGLNDYPAMVAVENS